LTQASRTVDDRQRRQQAIRTAAMSVALPRPRHGDPRDVEELRRLAAAVLNDDVQTLARTTAYLRRSYRVVFVGYVAMMVFGLAAVVAAFVKGLTASSMAEAAAARGARVRLSFEL
jgi:hypothetical protein